MPVVGEVKWCVEWCIHRRIPRDTSIYRKRLVLSLGEALRLARDKVQESETGKVIVWKAEFRPYAEEDAQRYPHIGQWDPVGEEIIYEDIPEDALEEIPDETPDGIPDEIPEELALR